MIRAAVQNCEGVTDARIEAYNFVLVMTITTDVVYVMIHTR
jgi:hypothetical protein